MASIYLDYAAATPLQAGVLRAMQPYLTNHFANPSSIYRAGVQARQALDTARTQVAELIGARAKEIIFTSGATESAHLAIIGAMRGQSTGKHVVAPATEHRAVLKLLEREGFEITFVPVDSAGRVDAKKVLAAVRPETALVCVMAANNELGTLAPLLDIGKGLLKLRKTKFARPLFYTDATQAVGTIPLDVSKLHVDLMSFAAAKIYGPKAVGALYVRDGLKVMPLFVGGNQEFGRRAGTENVAGIVGFGEACAVAKRDLSKREAHLQKIRAQFLSGLQAHSLTMLLNTPVAESAPHILNVTFSGIDGEELVLRLDAAGVQCSTASACKSSDFPSHVLRAIGLSPEALRSTLRFSFGWPTTQWEIRRAVRIIAATVDRLSH